MRRSVEGGGVNLLVEIWLAILSVGCSRLVRLRPVPLGGVLGWLPERVGLLVGQGVVGKVGLLVGLLKWWVPLIMMAWFGVVS